jgi:hypothetical protein
MKLVYPHGSPLDLNDGLYLVWIDLAQLPTLKAAHRDGKIKLGRIIDRDAKYATIEVPKAQTLAGLKKVASSVREA